MGNKTKTNCILCKYCEFDVFVPNMYIDRVNGYVENGHLDSACIRPSLRYKLFGPKKVGVNTRLCRNFTPYGKSR